MSDSKSGSKNDLNESNMPLLDEVSSSETLPSNILGNNFFYLDPKICQKAVVALSVSWMLQPPLTECVLSQGSFGWRG